MRNLLLPNASFAASRRWSFWVNTLAASPYVGYDLRKRLYRKLGLDIAPDAYEIGPRCYIHSADIRVGARTFINGYCWFENCAHLSIGAGVAIGPLTAVITSSHLLGPTASRASGGWHYRPVTIEDGSWIGARALLLPGVTVGHGSVIAAGAVVAEDTEPNCVYGGVPAKRLRELSVDESGAAEFDARAQVPTAPSETTRSGLQ